MYRHEPSICCGEPIGWNIINVLDNELLRHRNGTHLEAVDSCNPFTDDIVLFEMSKRHYCRAMNSASIHLRSTAYEYSK